MKKLTWQKLRAILAESGVLEAGWKVGTKRDSNAVAVVYHTIEKPGKRAVTKLTKVLDEAGIRHSIGEDTGTPVAVIRPQSIRE